MGPDWRLKRIGISFLLANLIAFLIASFAPVEHVKYGAIISNKSFIPCSIIRLAQNIPADWQAMAARTLLAIS